MTKRKLAATAIVFAAIVFAAIAVVAAAIALFQFAKKPEPAERETRELVIYSPHPVEITEYIVREFRQRTGIRATVISAGTGELIDRMKSESQRDGADLFWGGGIESLETVTDYFERYESTEDSSIRREYKAAHGLWHPFSVLPTVIIYNEALVPADRIPRSWKDLLDPWFENRLIMADPEKSGSSYTILATMLLTMRESGTALFSGWDYVERLIRQLGESGLAQSSNLVYRSVASGDFYAGITFENYVLSLKKTGANVGFSYPEEGTSAIPDGIALLKTAPHADEAKEFIDFVLGHDVQTILPARWQRRSVRVDIEPQIVGGEQNFIHYPIKEAARDRESILERWASLYERSLP